jgi:pullulanase/glycogen debranching enzyme
MNVRAFTADESSDLDEAVRGSYLGVIEKVRVSILGLAITSVLVLRCPWHYDNIIFKYVAPSLLF